MQSVLDSIKPVIKNAKQVSVDESAIDTFAASLKPSDFEATELSDGNALEGSDEEIAAFCIVFNAINFSYWSDPKWTVEIDGKQENGGMALLKIIKKAAENGKFLKADYLAGITKDEITDLFMGTIQIPMLTERHKILRELGREMLTQFNGSYLAVIERSSYDAQKLVEVLVACFPGIFKDEVSYHGQTVAFYKRAQLVPLGIDDFRRLGLTTIKLSNMGKLTAFADYKVPQVLRRFGILKYSAPLATKLDNYEEILAGSDEEIEIRASMIWAIELLSRKLRKRIPAAIPAKVDSIIWLQGQAKSAGERPYHRTRTIWY